MFPEGFFFSDLPDDLTDKFQGRYPSLAALVSIFVIFKVLHTTLNSLDPGGSIVAQW